MARHILCADGAEKQWGLDEGRMKVLNLYAGIGGNRKLWEDVEVTAVEINPEIAAIYQEHFPKDKVVVADAHKFLEERYADGWDFIWSSRPCYTHTRMRNNMGVSRGQVKPVIPDMKLYGEILFLREWFKGKWCVENVEPYYITTLLPPQKCWRHLFWANFRIPSINLQEKNSGVGQRGKQPSDEKYGISLNGAKLKTARNDSVLNALVHPKVGLHILNCARKEQQSTIKQWEVNQ